MTLSMVRRLCTGLTFLKKYIKMINYAACNYKRQLCLLSEPFSGKSHVYFFKSGLNFNTIALLQQKILTDFLQSRMFIDLHVSIYKFSSIFRMGRLIKKVPYSQHISKTVENNKTTPIASLIGLIDRR